MAIGQFFPRVEGLQYVMPKYHMVGFIWDDFSGSIVKDASLRYVSGVETERPDRRPGAVRDGESLNKNYWS